MGKKQAMRWSLGIASLLTALAGCAWNRTNLVEKGIVDVKLMKAPVNVKFAGVQVFQDDNEMVIFGNVYRDTRTYYWYSKHIDAVMLGPDGSPLHELKTQWQFDHPPHPYSNRLSFRVRFPFCPPTGSTLVLAYHHNPCSNNITSECLRNLGLSEQRLAYRQCESHDY